MSKTYDTDNVFAKILRGELPCHKVYEDAHALALMDIMPRCDGHVLVIPKAAARNIFDISPADLAAMMPAVQKVARAAQKAFAADGLTLHQANEGPGGQVVFHLHFHLMPRHAGVPLRPPASSMTKPEVLAAHAEKIRAALAEWLGAT